jgi:hypothetical protein
MKSKLIELINRSHIVRCHFDVFHRMVTFEITRDEQSKDVIVQFQKVHHYVISSALEINDNCAYIANISIDQLNSKEEKREAFKMLNYLFELGEDILKSPKYCLQIEGDLCVKLICDNYQIFHNVEM